MMANDKRLIDADALLMNVVAISNSKGQVTWSAVPTTDILTATTVDAAEVVRCKECNHWGGVPFGNVCRRWSAPLAGMKNCTGPDDFCSYGERRTDG